jgi:hypothetical protein
MNVSEKAFLFITTPIYATSNSYLALPKEHSVPLKEQLKEILPRAMFSSYVP